MNIEPELKSLDELNFDNSFTEKLPGDPEQENYRRQVSRACYSVVTPAKFPNASLVAYSREMAIALGLAPEECETEQFTRVFSGTELLESMLPYAQCYGGHQFGHWAGQLGDGRAINLGEVVTDSGAHWVLQLKGAGLTPYSRTADGLAVLRSSVREFLCSEAMYHLGIPTTRALSLITTGEMVERDMFYNGNPKDEPGAVVCRVSPSFIRFGSFEIFTSRQDIDTLTRLADYTITRDFPHLGEPSVETYIRWFDEICQRTADLMIQWMRVGFVHGVMNTDNMSILGLTIDYGPYGWLEPYDPDWTPNTTDAQGRRYRFGQQHQVALWNLVQLANALYPLIEQTEPLEKALEDYKLRYENGYRQMMAGKIGLTAFDADRDESLLSELTEILQLTETDMTIFFRELANLDWHDKNIRNLSTNELINPIADAFYSDYIEPDILERFAAWLKTYLRRLQSEALSLDEKRRQMNAVNPRYVLRNYLAQLAIDDAEQGDYGKLHELMDVLKQPYTDQPGKEHLAQKRPDWARHRAGCSMLSCSS